MSNLICPEGQYLREHPISAYTKYSNNLTYAHVHKGVTNDSFLENVTYVLTGYPFRFVLVILRRTLRS